MLAGCSDDPAGARDEGEEEQEQEVNNVAFLRVVIGSTTVVVNRQGAVIGNPVVIGPPPASITVVPLDANSQPVNLSATDFRVEVTTDGSARLTFARTSAFAGTLTRNAAGAATVTVGLFHTSKNHFDFPQHPISLTVQ